MRKSHVALLLLVGAVAALASTAFARVDELNSDDTPAKLINAQLNRDLRSAVARPGVAGGNDTVYVGFTPLACPPNNYWHIGTGAFRVYSILSNDYGYWGFDNDASHNNIATVHGDSLFGWWSVRSIMNGTGGQTRTDDNRPWWAVDVGNQVNYVINQGAGFKRTFGVVGVWHEDEGNTGAGAGKGVTWTPLSGNKSLWCGLRAHGDNSQAADPITGNHFNQTLLAYQSSSVGGGAAGFGRGTFHKFPGYASQWDQMAYRDIDVTGASTIDVRFRFRTTMSTGRGTTAATRTGWFDKDPYQVTTAGAAAGNFISSSAAGDVNCPIDSFMVYLGRPVDDVAGWLASDGLTHTVDPQRRYFAEVITANNAGTYREILSRAGNNADDNTFAASPITLAGTSLSGITANNKVRLVFRNKTNRGFDDEVGSSNGGYSSNGRGAVQIDDVEVKLDAGSFVNIGDFEEASDVDNSTSTNPLDAWKTTGKPPAIYEHVHPSGTLLYEDLCGPIGFVKRICNLTGNVVSSGDHDNSEANSGPFAGTAEREAWHGILSPTIQFAGPYDNSGPTAVGGEPGSWNSQGITAEAADVTEDYYLEYDIYTGVMDPFTKGVLWRFGFMSYPCKQVDGRPLWGDIRFPGFIIFNPDKQCFQDVEGGYQNGLIVWETSLATAGGAYPDSLRMYLGTRQECYRFGVVAGCSSTDGTYWDNISLAMIDGEVPPVSIDIWQLINDTFTVNGLNRAVLPVLAQEFDTTSALVKTGLNIAQTVTAPAVRFDVPGDTTAINAAGEELRLDMVFRINPGPGNYHTWGSTASGITIRPTSATLADPSNTGAGQSDEHVFWSQYIANNGGRGTGTAPGSINTEGSNSAHPGSGPNNGRAWSRFVWNSARCDTAEVNFWPIQGRNINPSPTLDVWATMYHESDPRYASLGILKNRCYLNSPTATVNQANIVCGNGGTIPAWVLVAGAGFPQPEVPSQANGLTYEYTKIMPDGQFTPGTHVEYFFRREDNPIGGGPYNAPDTTLVFPQVTEGSTDAHRWQEFSVLPDAWKKGIYGGFGSACVLYVDYNDRRGNERVWVSIADSIGATRAVHRGLHNGWRATGKENVNDPAGWVYENQQAGSSWDMFGVKASESLNTKAGTIGSWLSNHGTGQAVENKWSFQGPSPDMLDKFYDIVLILSGDLNSGIFGPFSNISNDDHLMMENFLLQGTSTDHKGLFIEGDGFIESEDLTNLTVNFMGVFLRHKSYSALTGNVINDCADLEALAPITTNGDVYGVRNSCVFTNDVYDLGPNAVASLLYKPDGAALPPVIAGAFHDIDATNGEFWQSLVDGFDVENLRSRFCDKSHGRLAYYYNALFNIFTKICPIVGAPGVTTDVPNNDDGQVFVDFMNLKNNPLMTGRATIDFGLSKGDRIEVKVFDVSGRLIRTLADRQFAPGKYTLQWDGVDNDGRQVPRGVYFTQVKYVGRGFSDARKLTVLK
jgi:hypothetical protein